MNPPTFQPNELATIEAVLQEIIDRIHAGDNPRLADVCNEHPHLSDELNSVWPALQMLDGCKKPLQGLGVVRAANLIDHKLGNYHLVREIGRGGMGVVYEAVQLPLGRRVAIKLLSELEPTSRSRARFEREFRIAASLHHTNIVPVFDAGEIDGQPYFAMQLVDGIGLEKLIDDRKHLPPKVEPGKALNSTWPQYAQAETKPEKRLPNLIPVDLRAEGEHCQAASRNHRLREPSTDISQPIVECRVAINIAIQIGKALEYAHQNGVCHRDIKPANILVDQQGCSWITDFGLAKPIGDTDLTQTGDIVGTLRYLAPERLDGQCDRRSDVYSLGLVLLELLIGDSVLVELDGRELLCHLHQRKRVRVPAEHRAILASDLCTIVEKAIRPEPEERYQTAQSFVEDLQLFVESKPIQAARRSPFRVMQMWAKRNRLAAILAIATIGSLLTGIIVASILAFHWYAASQLAQSHANQAETESKRSRESLDLTRRALADLSGGVVRDYMSRKRELMDDQRAYLRRVLDYHHQLTSLAGDDPDSQYFAALAERRVGNIYSVLGDQQLARQAFDSSLKSLASLTKTFPDRGEVREEYVSTLIVRGREFVIQNDLPSAQSFFSTAAAIVEDSRANLPESPRSIELLATAKHNLGLISTLRNEHELAFTFLEEARTLLSQLLDTFPDNTSYQSQLKGTLSLAGNVALKLGRNDEARKLLIDSVQMAEQLATNNPASAAVQSELASAYDYLGIFYLESNQFDEAIRALAGAKDILDELVKNYPGVIQYAQQQGLVAMRLGRAYELAEDKTNAEINYRAAIAFQAELFNRHSIDFDECRRLVMFRNALIEMLKRDRVTDAIELAKANVANFRELIAELSGDIAAQNGLADSLELLAGLLKTSDTFEADLLLEESQTIRNILARQ